MEETVVAAEGLIQKPDKTDSNEKGGFVGKLEEERTNKETGIVPAV
jgi:hypothetical protein